VVSSTRRLPAAGVKPEVVSRYTRYPLRSRIMGLAGSPVVAAVFVVTAAQETFIRPSEGLEAVTAPGAEGVLVLAGTAEAGRS
jgi:hypothetical protein